MKTCSETSFGYQSRLQFERLLIVWIWFLSTERNFVRKKERHKCNKLSKMSHIERWKGSIHLNCWWRVADCGLELWSVEQTNSMDQYPSSKVYIRPTFQEISVFYGTRSWSSLFHSTPHIYFFNIRFNIILQPTSVSPTQFFPLRNDYSAI
jgi:hypothetical protein